MDGLQGIGFSLVVLGIVIAAVGLVVLLGPRIPVLGHLPGDLVIRTDNLTIYIPLGTMLLVSVVASVVLGLLTRR
jgi:hypothetical protein